jgi:hypothetical protein
MVYATPEEDRRQKDCQGWLGGMPPRHATCIFPSDGTQSRSVPHSSPYLSYYKGQENKFCYSRAWWGPTTKTSARRQIAKINLIMEYVGMNFTLDLCREVSFLPA